MKALPPPPLEEVGAGALYLALPPAPWLMGGEGGLVSPRHLPKLVSSSVHMELLSAS